MIIYLTQRVEIDPINHERRDCVDQRWLNCLQAVRPSACIIAVPNGLANLERMLQEVPPGFVILSGGNDLPQMPGHGALAPERDGVESRLVDYARERSLPLLAVCRGFQHLNVLLGGALVTCEGHIRVQHFVSPPWSARGSGFTVNSYHRGGFRQCHLAPALTARLIAPDGTIEAASHETLPWLGVMWHPERENIDHERQLGFLQSFFC